MTRWRYNVYRVPPKAGEKTGNPDSAGSCAGGAPKGHEDQDYDQGPRTERVATLRHADSVYEDVM